MDTILLSQLDIIMIVLHFICTYMTAAEVERAEVLVTRAEVWMTREAEEVVELS